MFIIKFYKILCMSKRRGFFIVFEGPDRSGKTTQINLLFDFLKKKGFDVILTREPGGTDVGEKIREIILDPSNKISPLCELFLYEASRVQHINQKIKPLLSEGKIILCDRFTLATEAYQGYGRGIDIETVKTLNDIATDGIKPDLIIGFKIKKEDYIKRKRETADRIEQDDAFGEIVFKAYEKIYLSRNDIFVVDGSLSIDEIHEVIKKEVLKLINVF